MKQQMFSNERTYIPTYLRIKPVFDSLDSYDREIKSPAIWEDDGEVIAWGYRISGSETFFYSAIDYLTSENFEYIHLCQYICDRMTDLLYWQDINLLNTIMNIIGKERLEEFKL